MKALPPQQLSAPKSFPRPATRQPTVFISRRTRRCAAALSLAHGPKQPVHQAISNETKNKETKPMPALAQHIQADSPHTIDAEQTCFKYQATDILEGAPTKQYIYATNKEQAAAVLNRATIE